MTTEQRKSSVLTDDDYRVAKVWRFNPGAVARLVRDQGGIYEGILEAVQNAFDSPFDKYQDENPIIIKIPLLGDKEYRTLVASVHDFGAGITRDTEGQIQKFLNREKGLSPKPPEKGVRRFGIGMAQFPAVSATQIIFSRDREFIYRIPILQTDDGPAYGDWTFHKITRDNEIKFNMFACGTRVEFVDPHENMIDIEPMKLAKMIRQTFGWRLMLQPKTTVTINEIIKVDLPEYLRDLKPRFICRLNRARIADPNGRIKVVDPEVTGEIYADQKGRGMIHVHAGGYYIGEMKFADKRCSGAINIDEMPTDPSRRLMINESMKQDLEKHIVNEMKHFPDLPTDNDRFDEKKRQSMSELINKSLSQFNLPKLFKDQYKEQKRKRIEALGDPNTEGKPGYPKPENKPPQELETCELCNHLKTKSKRMRKKCDCPCHIPRKKGPDTKIGTASSEGQISIMVEENDLLNEQISSQLQFKSVREEGERLVRISSGVIRVNELHPIFDTVFKDKASKGFRNMAHFLAGEVMDIIHPNALADMTLEEFRNTQERITTKIIQAVE